MNAFAKHYEKNFELYEQLMDAGYISEKDMVNAINAKGDVSYKDQDEALMRIRDAAGKHLNLDDKFSKEFYEGIPQVQKFTPNKEDWRDYDQEQMGRLAEEMKFNWKNKDDRSKMMKILTDETIKRDKQKIYEDYKKEHPAAAFINENILAPNVSERSKKGEDITNKDVFLDAANVGTYMIPGAGTITNKAGKAALLAADAIAQGAVGAASDINQGNELGLHNVVMPALGAGMGAVTELVPRMAKGIVDATTGGFGGELVKPVSDVGENWITKVFGNEVETAKNAIAKEAKKAKDITTIRKNASEATQNELAKKGISFTPNADAKQFAKDKNYYAKNPDKWKADIDKKKLSRTEQEKFLADPNFAKVIEEASKNVSPWVKRGKSTAQTLSRQGGKGFVITNANKSRHENAKPKIEDVFSDPEMSDYIRLRRRGYSPQIPSKYKEYKDAVDAEIFDYRKNLLGE